MYRVLVVDDEHLILNLLREALTRYGYMVKTASTVREAVCLFDEESFDLVITDMCMPDGDGKCLVRHIRNSGKGSVAVMGISGTPWVLKQAQCEKVLAKPFTLDSLRSCVDELLAGHASVNGTTVDQKAAFSA